MICIYSVQKLPRLWSGRARSWRCVRDVNVCGIVIRIVRRRIGRRDIRVTVRNRRLLRVPNKIDMSAKRPRSPHTGSSQFKMRHPEHELYLRHWEGNQKSCPPIRGLDIPWVHYYLGRYCYAYQYPTSPSHSRAVIALYVEIRLWLWAAFALSFSIFACWKFSLTEMAGF